MQYNVASRNTPNMCCGQMSSRSRSSKQPARSPALFLIKNIWTSQKSRDAAGLLSRSSLIYNLLNSPDPLDYFLPECSVWQGNQLQAGLGLCQRSSHRETVTVLWTLWLVLKDGPRRLLDTSQGSSKALCVGVRWWVYRQSASRTQNVSGVVVVVSFDSFSFQASNDVFNQIDLQNSICKCLRMKSSVCQFITIRFFRAMRQELLVIYFCIMSHTFFWAFFLRGRSGELQAGGHQSVWRPAGGNNIKV